MATFVRGSNPVWSFVDLSGHQFDDSFYMFVLENTLPYIPATVWHDPFGNVPWTNPIQFLANGTLPVDIYWDPDMVYRLEFRQGNTQADPLIYLVENYSPNGSGGGTPPIEEVAITTDNQITNPQFSLVSFSSPFTFTGAAPDPIPVAPGWDLILAGSGTVTLEQVPLSSIDPSPTNAPYAIRITLTGGWSGTPYIRQIFGQAGMLWANKFVSGSITAKVGDLQQVISSRIDDSMGSPLAVILQDTIVNDSFDEYTGQNELPDTTNTDVPPDAYIEYKIFFPVNADIYLTSIQLVAGDFELPLAYPYEQQSVERQVDHTFHYYRDSILFQPKSSILTGWDFGLNPWQFTTTTSTDLANNAYTADQTIVIQQAYVSGATPNNIQVGQGSAAQNYGFKVTSKTATNQFAILQYIDPAIVRPYWGNTLSSLVKVFVQKQSSVGNLRVKMRLIRSTGLPTATNQTYPIAAWTALGEPTYNGAWTAVAPINDPVYNLVGGENIITFDGFDLDAATNANETLAIVFYTIDPMTSSGTPDFMLFRSISLVPNDFAIESNALTFAQTLADCQYYYQKSFPMGMVPTTNVGNNLGASFGIQVTAAGNASTGPIIRFPVIMRATPSLVTLYNPIQANNNIMSSSGTAWINSSSTELSVWGFVSIGASPAVSAVGSRSIVHWSSTAQLGI